MIQPGGDQALEASIERARRLLNDGAYDQAEAIYAQVLRVAPEHVEALSFLGIGALARGQVLQAIDMFERARERAPYDVQILKNLGIAYRNARRHDDACMVLKRALQLDPQFFLARLHLGAVCEDLGRSDDALIAYFGAISVAQKQGRWRNDETTAPALRPLVRHAMSYVDIGRARIFSELLDPLRVRYGRAELLRVEKCVATYLGDLPAAYSDDRQRPTLLYFPDLPTQPWFGRDLFPWYEQIESQTSVIRDELALVLQSDNGLEPFLDLPSPGQSQTYLQGRNGAPQWNAFFFHRHGIRYEQNCARCPQTTAALDAIPLVSIRDHAPECLFSVLTPGTHIMPHHGVTNTRLVTHLPLIVPEECILRVGGEDHAWQEGRCITFDDTFLHEAWNHSQRTRVVVLMDTWNPHLSEAERAAIGDIVAAIGDFSRAATTLSGAAADG
jgi:aspartate beta-hydroxylase